MLDFFFKTKKYEDKLDRLYPQLGHNKRCACCGASAEHIHHIIPRANKLLRWDVNNLLPLCAKCHQRVHDRKERFIISPVRRKYLKEMKNKDFKQYLIEQGLTREDFYKLKEQQLNEAIK